MERGGQPPGSATADEHEQGKLVERVRSPRLFLRLLGEREPPHLGDGHVLGDAPRMFDLIRRSLRPGREHRLGGHIGANAAGRRCFIPGLEIGGGR